jgi:hypothetical protein
MQINNNPGYTFGTWTPDLQFGGAKVGITYNLRSGSWLRFGAMCIITGMFRLTSKGTSVGAATIAGLPFTAVGLGGYAGDYPMYVGPYGSPLPITPLSILMGSVISGTSFASLYQDLVTNGTVTVVENTNFGDTTRLMFSAIYTV